VLSVGIRRNGVIEVGGDLLPELTRLVSRRPAQGGVKLAQIAPNAFVAV
jgi:hypothetical protein